jgi:hypothetical protein
MYRRSRLVVVGVEGRGYKGVTANIYKVSFGSKEDVLQLVIINAKNPPNCTY